ncbi:FAD-dependent oxidoreductase [Oxyplasma meridianum]|uniref:FAD-dependent oxidoreductase n=1 Tax=Oxyplasma meridianum TaxID=3073602 RepID=A0AAX4NEL0_9ARCH
MNFIVIGGGAAGMSAASKAKRSNPSLSVTVLESGKYVSYAECGIPYLIQGIVPGASNLLHYPITEFTINRKIDVQTGTKVENIDRKEKTLLLQDGRKLKYDKLLISTGGTANVPFGRSFKNVFGIRSLESGEYARSITEKYNEILIVGDGVLGLELASVLLESGKSVTLISKHSRILQKLDEDIAEVVQKAISSKIKVLTDTSIKDIKEIGDGKLSVETFNGKLQTEVVIFAVGITPNVDLARKAGLDLFMDKAILVNRSMQTSDPDIYAAGDVATTTNLVTKTTDWQPLAQVANKMGRVAGSNVAGKLMEFPGSLGTTLVKILDLEVGFTGLNSSELKRKGIEFREKMVKAKSKAAYYPGSEDVYVKILISKENDTILGGQIVSKDGGAWRLNALAMAIQGGFTVEDLFYGDLGYSPPFGPVWDPIIIAASISMRD